MSRVVVVTGGRDFAASDVVAAALDTVHAESPIILLLHGGASGADALGARWAREHGVAARCVPADWGRHGRAAGPRRNTAMLLLARELAQAATPNADVLVVAFPGGRGTAHCVREAQRLGLSLWQEPTR